MQFLRLLWTAGFVAALASSGYAQSGPAQDARPGGAVAAAYEKLLARYPRDSQGLGPDDHFQSSKPQHQPMTYGIILSSEALRFRRTGNEDSRRRIRQAMEWLVANADLDGDDKPGWGLPQAWDAFQDGSANPPNHPYTITSAIVLNGMLDALSARSLWSAEERELVSKLAGSAVMRWCREVWSEGHGGGYFWYSPNPADAHFAVNTPAMFLGSMVRLKREHPQALSAAQHRLVGERADALARAIVNTVQLRDGKPFWDYMAWPNFRKVRRPNDLVHHVYTVMGIETYRDGGGTVSLPWKRSGAVRSLDVFWAADGQIRQFPQDVEYPPEQASLGRAPAILWGAGGLLAGYGMWNDRDGAARTLAAIERDYGPLPDLRLYPRGARADDGFYPRQAAHVLWGLARYAFGTADQ